MKSNLPKVLLRYALWVTQRDGTSYIVSTLFNSREAAMTLFGEMPRYCRANGDCAGAKGWETARADIVEVHVVEPSRRGEMAHG